MKFSIEIRCSCGTTFPLSVSGSNLPKDAKCPSCDQTIWLVEPLGNVVGMAILQRASSELKNSDWTLAIVLGAMAVECQLAFLFMKWKRVDLIAVRNPTSTDEEAWESEWRDDARTIAARLDKVSYFLTGQSFDSLLAAKTDLSAIAKGNHGVSIPNAAKQFFVKELFYKRNRIVHFGNIDSDGSEAEKCVKLARVLWDILVDMDKQRLHTLEAKWSVQTGN